jgi:TPR repeat protein
LQTGFGVKSDLPQAATWMKKASDAGRERASIRYASIMLCGIGVNKVPGAGERLLQQTVDRGSWLAMSERSSWNDRGDCGFKKDAALGRQWREKADAAQLAATELRRKQRQ